MIIVDSNILAYLLIPGEHTKLAEALFKNHPDWAVPVLWRSEFRNILANYMRKKLMTLEDAQKLQLEAESILEDMEFQVDSEVVLKLARESGCSAYDCEFVALAEQLNIKLVTMDSKLLKAFPLCATALTASRP